jgi:hypothetical protein
MWHTKAECAVTSSDEERRELIGKRRREAATRALAEAAARRAEAKRLDPPNMPQSEKNGRGGLDPIRYGDWEVKGIAIDF